MWRQLSRAWPGRMEHRRRHTCRIGGRTSCRIHDPNRVRIGLGRKALSDGTNPTTTNCAVPALTRRNNEWFKTLSDAIGHMRSSVTKPDRLARSTAGLLRAGEMERGGALYISCKS